MTTSSLSQAFIEDLRAWAARDEDLLLSVVLNGYSIALFKEDIDGAPDDDQLRQLLLDRLAARPKPNHQPTSKDSS